MQPGEHGYAITGFKSVIKFISISAHFDNLFTEFDIFTKLRLQIYSGIFGQGQGFCLFKGVAAFWRALLDRVWAYKGACTDSK
jgi:hypothetical protein